MTASGDDNFGDDPPLPVEKPDTREDVLKELNSSYGDFSSFTMPYKRVETLESEHIFYDAKQRDFYSKIAITSDHQIPGGDTYYNTRHFTLSRLDAAVLAETAPEGFKRKAKAVAEALQQAFDRQREALMAHIDSMGTGMPAPVPAPERARFKPPKDFSPG